MKSELMCRALVGAAAECYFTFISLFNVNWVVTSVDFAFKEACNLLTVYYNPCITELKCAKINYEIKSTNKFSIALRAPPCCCFLDKRLYKPTYLFILKDNLIFF